MKENNYYNYETYPNFFDNLLLHIDSDAFYEVSPRLEKIKITLKYLDELLKLDYKDKVICEILNDLREFLENKFNVIRGAYSIKRVKDSDYPKNYIPERLKYYFYTKLILNYKAIDNERKQHLYNKAYGLFRIISENDFYLLNNDSFENFKKLFSMYISVKEEFNSALMDEKDSFLTIYRGKIFKIEENLKKCKSYNRFSSIFNKITLNKYAFISKYIVYSDEFVSHTQEENYATLDKHIEDLVSEINNKKEEIDKTSNYMDIRMLRMKNIIPKNMTTEEKNLFDKLIVVTDKKEFDELYSTVYIMFTNHVYDEAAFKKNLEIKKTLEAIIGKIYSRFCECCEYTPYSASAIAIDIKEYMYRFLDKILSDYKLSFDVKVISKLKFIDFEHDVRLVNEAINYGKEVSENDVYIPRTDNKYFDKRCVHQIVELTFEDNIIEIDQLTDEIMQDGDISTNYDDFANRYISLDTFIKKANYIGKHFISNDYHKEDSQDFSNSTLEFSYNGILLILTNGLYEVVSHEAITIAGYDIPEPDKIKVKDIEYSKYITINNITCAAECYREERTSTDYEKKLK